MNRIALMILAGVIWSCSTPIKETTMSIPNDPHTFARPAEAVAQHLSLDINVDFSQKKISGTATYIIDKNAEAIYFDTRELTIFKVTDQDGNELSFNVGEADEVKGQPLMVNVNDGTTSLAIQYETSEHAEALQWLDPVQTAGKEHPFLFTQSQAILARTWIPVQDSPGIRFSYDARVQVPKGLMALMSAENPTQVDADGVYTFKMDQPIPAYLMALAVGNLEFEALTDRTGVYAEPSMLDKSAAEFTDMEEMLKISEQLYGPYRWDRYDVIVLPPSFPFGGMENPRLTFATPTIITGDKSLVSLIAHEMAHSWSGNLVTNATWNDFWLNEGFTVYFEYRIMGKLYGKSYAEMLASLAQQDLKKEVKAFITDGMADNTKLKLDLSGRNPDDGVTTVAYDKGYNFLRYLEERVGRETWDAFVKQYFKAHAFKSMDTESFLEYLKKELFEKNNIDPKWDEVTEWVYDTGLPATMPVISSDRFTKVDAEFAEWTKEQDASKIDTTQWTTHEWMHFIRQVSESNPTAVALTELDAAFGFTTSGNAEILCAWFQPAIKAGYSPAYAAMETFLINTGRRKFLTPLYSEMVKTEDGKKMAMDIYSKARPNYHFVAVNTMDKVLGWSD